MPKVHRFCKCIQLVCLWLCFVSSYVFRSIFKCFSICSLVFLSPFLLYFFILCFYTVFLYFYVYFFMLVSFVFFILFVIFFSWRHQVCTMTLSKRGDDLIPKKLNLKKNSFSSHRSSFFQFDFFQSSSLNFKSIVAKRWRREKSHFFSSVLHTYKIKNIFGFRLIYIVGML